MEFRSFGPTVAELVSQLFHADLLITEQADRIDALDTEVRPATNNAR